MQSRSSVYTNPHGSIYPSLSANSFKVLKTIILNTLGVPLYYLYYYGTCILIVFVLCVL